MGKIFNILLVMFLVMGNVAYAQQNSTSKAKPKVVKTNAVEDINVVYLYGMAFNPSDSVVYLTDELMIDNPQIYKKTKFLVNRDEYSQQLKDFMDSRGLRKRTCAITYATTVKSLDKKYNKHISYLKKRGYLVKFVEQSEFRFKTVRENMTTEDNR